MKIQDEEILKESKTLICAFKKQLAIINGESLSKHIIGFIRTGIARYRDPDNNWTYKDYQAKLDDEITNMIGIDHGFFLIIGTEMRDYYLTDLIDSFTINTEDKYNSIIDEERIKSLESQWRSEIKEKYQINEHIRRFIWDLKPFKNSPRYGHLREKIIEIYNNNIPYSTDVYSFTYGGFSCKCLDYNDPYGIHVALTKVVGFWGGYVQYGKDTTVLPDQKMIFIPSTIYAPGLRHCTVTEISNGIFESLHNVEIIKLPSTIEKIEWSFWHCKKLRSIEVDSNNKNFCSIDGVLYSRNRKILYAYPCAHGNIYEVPEGVEVIEHFAFKDCDKLEILMLPSTIKKINKNAFYRAINLKKIVCSCKKDSFINEGFYGDYGNVYPQWYYLQ